MCWRHELFPCLGQRIGFALLGDHGDRDDMMWDGWGRLHDGRWHLRELSNVTASPTMTRSLKGSHFVCQRMGYSGPIYLTILQSLAAEEASVFRYLSKMPSQGGKMKQ